MGDYSRPDRARHPHHPPSYEITDPAEAAEVRAVRELGRRRAAEAGDDPFGCSCGDDEGTRHPTPESRRLLDPLSQALAAGAEEPAPPAAVPLSVALGWLGAVRQEPRDAAWLLAERAPMRLLAGAATAELAWAVRESDRAGLEGAVRFFASEEFTTRHPKRRRVPDTARDMLLRHARSHRPADLAVLERRLLRAPEDRIRRS